jgi:phosphatidylcholine synthase
VNQTAARGFVVHLLTASGAALALIAVIAATRSEWVAVFLALGLAGFVDAIDGPLARRLDVAKALPRWSGDVLDLIVDFVTYVFVPAYVMVVSSLLPKTLAIPLGVVVVVSGAVYFADREMKSAGNYFRGFPALWNVAAFYLFVLKPAPALAAAMILVLAILTFVPFRFVHPLRVRHLRPLNLALLSLAGVMAAIALAQELDPSPWVTAVLAVVALYFMIVGSTDRSDLPE